MNNPLTFQQQVILDYLAEGFVPKQVAHELKVSTQTVKWHLTQARRRLGARNTTHAVAIYLRQKNANRVAA